MPATITQNKPIPRYSDISFPPRTEVGRAEALRVVITLNPITEKSVSLALQAPTDETEPMKVDACVVISPLDFDLKSSSVQTIEVNPHSDSAPIMFKLVPKNDGRKTIAVEFFQNAYSGC